LKQLKFYEFPVKASTNAERTGTDPSVFRNHWEGEGEFNAYFLSITCLSSGKRFVGVWPVNSLSHSLFNVNSTQTIRGY
jgi:hypothetical protein